MPTQSDAILQTLFADLELDGPNDGDWAVKNNVGMVAERLGHSSPTETRVDHIEVTCQPADTQQPPQIHSYAIGPGKYASAIWAEACADPKAEAQSGEIRSLTMSSTPESQARLDILAQFMGKQVMTAAATPAWSAKDHVVSAILQAPAGAEITLKARFK
ncbi:hypothetical protein [Magnetococcus sp. PR-3]|uniref:hypothetical protein n=1 Tax=Magnetococcus sp. PR-3 TaxID=3120355 RepID=UPI002FCE2A1C